MRGDTASGGGNKPATLETGATVNVPLFVNIGDRLKVDTRSGSTCPARTRRLKTPHRGADPPGLCPSRWLLPLCAGRPPPAALVWHARLGRRTRASDFGVEAYPAYKALAAGNRA